MDTLFFSYAAITAISTQKFHCYCALPVPDVMILSTFLLLSMRWKNICQLFPYRICAWTPLWTTCLPILYSKTEKYGLLLTSMINVAIPGPSTITLQSTNMGFLSVPLESVCSLTVMTNPEDALCGDVLMGKTMPPNVHITVLLPNMVVS